MQGKGTEALLGAMEKFSRMVYVARRFSYQKLYDTLEPVFHEHGWREAERWGSENILVISLDPAGDNVMMSAFVRELRRNFPKARIAMLVRSYLADLWKLCPYINELLVFEPGLEENRMRWLSCRVRQLCAAKSFGRCILTAAICPNGGTKKGNFALWPIFPGRGSG